MPVSKLDYKSPLLLRNPHIHTIYASFSRPSIALPDVREERIETPDKDFIDVDWYEKKRARLLIISHGLEGHSRRPYVVGMAKHAISRGWDVLAWNYRSCNGEPNRNVHSYHSGSTSDLNLLTRIAVDRGYDQIALCGFSIGGNKTLLYLSRDKDLLPKQVKGAITFSVPCDLVSSSAQLAKAANRVYMRNFLKTLGEKLKQKQAMFPERISLEGFRNIKTFEEFDERYTAPMNGFDSALDYWQKSSSGPHLHKIDRPAALITALDDPFLTPQCFPYAAAEENDFFHLLLTQNGGHVGFVSQKGQPYFSEQAGLDFLENRINWTN